MIISQEVMPEKNLYYVGAVILSILKEKEYQQLLYIYDEYINKMKELKLEKVSLEKFILSIDWLYLIGAIDKDIETNALYLIGK